MKYHECSQSLEHIGILDELIKISGEEALKTTMWRTKSLLCSLEKRQ